MGAVTHQTGCEHIEPGLYAVKRPTSGAETVVLVVLALGHDRFAVRKAGTDKILTAARSELCITAPPGTATSVRDNATQCPTP